MPDLAGIDQGGNVVSGYQLKALDKRLEVLEDERRRLVAVIDAIVAYEIKTPKARKPRTKLAGAGATVRTRMIERMRAEPSRVWSAREMESETGDDAQQVRNTFKRLLVEGAAARTAAGRYALSSTAASGF